MPTRLLREGILTSERIDQLDAGAEVFYRRLMSKVDDHGLYDARPAILRASLYPLRVDRVREADCSRWIAACEKAGLIALYQHDGRPYLQMKDTRWQVRAEPKFPPPPENGCKQVLTAVHLDGVGVVDEVVLPPSVVGKRSALPDCPQEEILNAFHEELPTLPRVVVLTEARKTALRARWREVCTAEHFDREAGLAWFRSFYRMVGKSAFLTGRKKDWKAGFDWLHKAQNFAKCIEGNYQEAA